MGYGAGEGIQGNADLAQAIGFEPWVSSQTGALCWIGAGTQHGGQETTLLAMSTFFFHMGMVIAGVTYSAKELSNVGEVSGGTPYGASTIAGPKGDRQPTANELAVARAQGRHVATIAAKLAK